jgi:hypothetical protein
VRSESGQQTWARGVIDVESSDEHEHEAPASEVAHTLELPEALLGGLRGKALTIKTGDAVLIRGTVQEEIVPGGYREQTGRVFRGTAGRPVVVARLGK